MNVINIKHRLILVLSLVIVFTIPSRAFASCYIPDDLKFLLLINPEVEAQAAINDGNVICKGVYGYSLQVPGIPGNPYCWSKAGLVEIVPGTTDAACSNEHANLQSVAYSFAEVFNRTVFRSNDSFNQHAGTIN